jgi:UDP-N-acetylmuramoylalanine--D-glutamate ligase
MTIAQLQSKKVILLLGYGVENQSVERFLKHHAPHTEIRIADKTRDANYLNAQNAPDIDLVVRTPGLPKQLVNAPSTTATNIFFANCTNTVVGVTGSKGKSTTSALIAAILKASGKTVHLVGNIGNPALDVLLGTIGADDLFVYELSSYQLEDCAYSPHIAVYTNFFPEHLTHHGSLEAYAAAKAHITLHQTDKDFFVYNPRINQLNTLAGKTVAKPMPFVRDIAFETTNLPLRGEHNLENIRAALTVAEILSLRTESVRHAIETFEPLPHRLATVGTFREITFVDDAIATAPEPTIFGIETLGDVDTIFLGGEDRGYDFGELADVIFRKHIKNVVLFPESGIRIEEALKKHCEGAPVCQPLPRILHTKSMEEAVRFAYEHTAPGMTCLLSTASPSYTLWKNFEAKGEEFVRWVKELGKV